MSVPFSRRTRPDPEDQVRPADDPAGPATGCGDSPPPAPPPAGPRLSRGVAASACLAAGLLFALLAVWVARRGTVVTAADTHLHSWALSHRGSGSVAIANAVRWGGVTEVVLPALVVVGSLAARPGGGIVRRLGAGIVLSLVASAGVYTEILVNHAIGRHRPPVSDWAGAASGAAFPSGHTTAATLFALSCGWVITARMPAGWRRRAVWAGAAAYAAVVGWSRVWLGVHWPTDVLGGWLFGLTWLAGSVVVIRSLPSRRKGGGTVRDA